MPTLLHPPLMPAHHTKEQRTDVRKALDTLAEQPVGSQLVPGTSVTHHFILAVVPVSSHAMLPRIIRH